MSDTPPPFACADCGVNVAVIGEWYVLRDSIWEQATRNTPARFLCVGCLEERLSRRLAPDDFHPTAPANITREEDIPERLRVDLTPIVLTMSARLRSRIEGAP